MSLLDKLKSLLGLGGSGSTSKDDREVGVTVERDSRRRTEADTERAVKESPPPGDGNGAGLETTTGTGVDHADEAEEAPAGMGTTAEGSGTDGEGGDDHGGEAEAEDEAATEDPEADDEEEPRVPSEAVDVIKGIGPTYADRLSDAGVETVADLAEADAADLAERADVPGGRVENWVEQAQARRR
jgi:predicted flap endonuclease-1-like 5' DNA nuclease